MTDTATPTPPMPAWMTYTNCLVGAIYLRWKLPGTRIRAERWKRCVPHWFVEAEDGTRWHYRPVREVTFWPVSIAVFCGRIERVEPGQSTAKEAGGGKQCRGSRARRRFARRRAARPPSAREAPAAATTTTDPAYECFCEMLRRDGIRETARPTISPFGRFARWCRTVATAGRLDR